jgi:hypothetical protein
MRLNANPKGLTEGLTQDQLPKGIGEPLQGFELLRGLLIPGCYPGLELANAFGVKTWPTRENPLK